MAINITGSWDLTGAYSASLGFYGTASFATSASYALNHSVSDLLSETFYGTPVQTVDPGSGSIIAFNISASGLHYISGSMGANTSASVNIFWHPDSLSNGQLAGVKMSVPAGAGGGNAIVYRTLVSASNATAYWYPNTAGATSSTNLIRQAARSTHFVPFQVANVSYIYKDYDGVIWMNNGTTNVAGLPLTAQVYEFTGSLGTPIV